MRAIGIGPAAILIVASVATSAFAAKFEIPAAARKAGMAGAPTLVQAAKLPCEVTDAWLLGESSDGTKKKVYEVACKDGLGYIVAGKPDDATPPTALDCVMVSGTDDKGKPNPMACKLPANANPGAGLNSLMTASGRPCTVDKARYIGTTGDQNNLYEVACHEGAGYVLRAPIGGGKPPIASMCAIFGPASGVKCELTTAEQQQSAIDQLVAASGKACAVKARRYVGSTSDRTDFFEVACNEGNGYMLQVSAAGKVEQALDCVKAVNFAGGCSLTDTRQAETEQDAVYTNLSKKAGFDCTVSKYAEFPARADGAEMVELACSNRPDGGVGVFPAKGQPQVWDCLIAGAEGYNCSLTSDVSPLYSKLSNSLKAKGKGSCVVSGARPYAKLSNGDDLIEVACADGGPGWVVQYSQASTVPTDLLNCVQAAKLGGGGCQLPTNKSH
jgi:hypothetical protein